MKKVIFILTCFISLMSHCVTAQIYDDYYGAGQTQGISVTSSGSDGINSINGKDYLTSEAETSRFLSQATLGYNYEEIERASSMGIDAWLEDQFSLAYSSYYEAFYDKKDG